MPALLKDDMEAINSYIMTSAIKTKAADNIKTEWIKWWADHERSWTWYSQEEYDTARNFRTRFNNANAVTTAEKEAAKRQATTGITKEETKGGVRRTTSEGVYIVPDEPLVSTSVKVGLFTALVIGVLGWGAKILYIDPILMPATKALGKAKTKKALEKYI